MTDPTSDPTSPSLARFLADPAQRDEDLDALLAALPQAVVIGDEAGLIRVNAAALRLFDAKPTMVGHMTFADFAAGSSVVHTLAGQHLTRNELPFAQALIGRSTACDASVSDSGGGRQLALRCTGAPIRRAGGQVGALVVYSDVSDLRQTTEVLTRANQELREFAAVVAHDLHEPLRMVSSFLQLATLCESVASEERPKRFLGFAADGVQRMQKLIDSLLDLTRAGQQRLARSQVDCDEVVREALANLQLALADSGAEIMASPLPMVHADRALLVQLFQNLIGNAIKYARSGVAPRIQISAERRERDTLFTVCDNGIGISAENRQRVFAPFDRLGEKSATPGNGLGLTICRRIVSRHRGDIWVDGAPGAGCVFTFTIPHQADDGALEPREPYVSP